MTRLARNFLTPRGLRTLTSPSKSSPAGHASTFSITSLATLLGATSDAVSRGSRSAPRSATPSRPTAPELVCARGCVQAARGVTYQLPNALNPRALLRYAMVHFKLIRVRPKHKASSTSNSPTLTQTTCVYHDNDAVFVHATST